MLSDFDDFLSLEFGIAQMPIIYKYIDQEQGRLENLAGDMAKIEFPDCVIFSEIEDTEVALLARSDEGKSRLRDINTILLAP
jgi:hypothetical protein